MSPVDNFYNWYTKEIKDLQGKKKKGRKATKNYYFTHITDHAIVAYNNETCQTKRDKIFNEHLYYPLNKLAENVYHTYKFPYINELFEDIQAEVVAFLIEKLDRYKLEKGKGYSYFTIVCRNYLIIRNKTCYEKLKGAEELSVIDDTRDVLTELSIRDHKETLSSFIDEWVEFYAPQLNRIFDNKRDIIIADTILELFRQRENIINFNKKALYILIRERTGLRTLHVTNVVNKIKEDFIISYAIYQQSGRLQ